MNTGNGDARAATARIAADYDLVPYNPEGVGSPGLDLSCLFGVAALYDNVPPRPHAAVLDLGCGGGAQLLRAAAETTGPLIGLDVSQAACAEARARCAHLGARCLIQQADLLDLDPASLGAFDVIYLVGVYYVAPPAVQARLIEILAHCLAPGGVALISYYSPEIWRSIDALRRALRQAVDMTLPPPERIAAARRHIETLRQAGAAGIDPRIFEHALTCAPSTFFHEMLGERLAPVTTGELEALLAPAGIHFLNWMMPGDFGSLPAPVDRAAAADRTPGGYHYALFAKGKGEGGAWPHVRWHTPLRRAGMARFGLPFFADPRSGQGLTIANAGTAAALDRLAAGSCSWPEIEAGLGTTGADIAGVKRDFLALWSQGAVTPRGVIPNKLK